MKDNRSKTSAENGKKGGRPVSESVIRALKARDYISAEVEKQMSPIVARAINDAIRGDRYAVNGYQIEPGASRLPQSL